MKKLEVEKNKPIFITSVEYKVVLDSSIYNFFINKMSLANKWMRKKIPSFCNLALCVRLVTHILGWSLQASKQKEFYFWHLKTIWTHQLFDHVH